MKITFLKRLIGISRFIVEVLKDQTVISQNELKLLGSVEK